MALILRAHRVLCLRIGPLLVSSFLFHSVMLGVGLAAVTSAITGDGSMGTMVTQTQNAYTISGGTITGSNLFHSFGRFSVGTGDQATFTGPPAIANIVSRITGGELSVIDGLLRSDITGANLYLLNPSGVLFGPNARLDVSGSFHVSTADFLRFADGAKFSTHLGQESVLTVASPTAFGFLGNNPAAVTIQGSALKVSEGKALSVVGGDVQIVGGALSAPRGRIQLASVASAGEAMFSPLELAPDLQVDSFTRLGRLTLSQGALVDASGNGGGTVLVRSGHLLVDRSYVLADNTGPVDGSGLGVDLRITADAVMANGAAITTDSLGAGRARDVWLTASSVHMDDALLRSRAFASGDGGNVTVHVGTLALTGGAQIDTGSVGAGKGGQLTVVATDAIAIAGHDREGRRSVLSSQARGKGDAGRIAVSAPILTIDEGVITTATLGLGRAGDIVIQAGQLTLTGGAIIYSSTDGAGRAGDIVIEAGQLTLTGGSFIDSGSGNSGTGQGGTLTITATDSVAISGTSSDGLPSGVLNFVRGSGDGGRVIIVTPTLRMDEGFITTRTFGAGRAGDIVIEVGQLILTSGASIDSGTGESSTGQGGTITITATDSVAISGTSSGGLPSTISSTAGGSGAAGRVIIGTPILRMDEGFVTTSTIGAGRAGDIVIEAGQVTLTSGASIDSFSGGSGSAGTVTVTAADSVAIAGQWGDIRSGLHSFAAGSGDAGRVTIVTPTLSVDGGSISTTSTFGAGRAGDIVIEVGQLILTSGASIDSSTNGSGQGGTITITATDSIAISGTSSGGLPSTISSFTLGRGNAGRVIISTRVLIMDGGFITTATGGEGHAGDVEVQVGQLTLKGGATIDSSTFSPGHGGDIELRAQHVELSNGAVISARSTEDGDAGTLRLQVGETFRSENGRVTTAAERAGGGAISLRAGRLVQLFDSEITTSVRGGGGDAGNISLNAPFIVLDGSQLIANAFEGIGGNIRLEAEVFLADPASLVSASSALGLQGTVDIRAPVTSLSGTLAPLPQAFVSAAALLPARCAARGSGGVYSTLVVGGRGGLPPEPGGLLSSPLRLDTQVSMALPGSRELRRHQSVSGDSLLHVADKIFPRLQRELPQGSTPLALACCDQEVRRRPLATLHKVCEDVAQQEHRCEPRDVRVSLPRCANESSAVQSSGDDVPTSASLDAAVDEGRPVRLPASEESS